VNFFTLTEQDRQDRFAGKFRDVLQRSAPSSRDCSIPGRHSQYCRDSFPWRLGRIQVNAALPDFD